MSENSAIEWTHHSFNSWWGCTKVSPACARCYAETWAKRYRLPVWGQHAERRFFGDTHWDAPLAWNRAAAREGVRKRVFCASMADVFEARADLDPWRVRLWKLIEATPWLDWLLLTKRPENVGAMVPWGSSWASNVWLGTTVENAEWAAKRIPALLQHPAAIRFLSCEPLLGAIDLTPWLSEIDWVIVGGESGHGARPMAPAWARSLRDQCVAVGVSFFFKQWGDIRPATSSDAKTRRIVLPDNEGKAEVVMERVGKKKAGRELDGRTWNDVPSVRLPARSGAAAPDDELQRDRQRGTDRVDSSAQPWVTHSGHMNQKDIAMKKPGQEPRSKAKRNPFSTMHQGHAELTIDREIATLIPSLSPEELAQLERSIVAEGCREPLSVWDDGQRRILLDGHNRYSICGRHGVAYELRLIQLADRDAAIRWVAENQLGRRNLTPEAQSYLRGTLYNNTKRQGSRSDLTSGQSAQKLTTAQQLAERHKVDEKTIRRDAYFAEKLDALARADSPDIKDQVLTRGARISRADVPRLLALDEETRARFVTMVRQGAKASVLLRDLGRRGSIAAPSGATSTRPSSRRTGHVTGDLNSAAEHLEMAAGILRSLSPGSVSSEAIEHLGAQVRAIKDELERHRLAVAQPADGPRVDVLAAAQAVFELESEGILSSPMTILDRFFADPTDAHALQKQFAEVRGMIARRARNSPRFSKRRRLIIPANNILDPTGERLLSFKTFSTIQRYLARHEPRIQRMYKQYMESRSSNPEHARICEIIDRLLENGGSDIADNTFSYFHYLKTHCTDAEASREAMRAAGQEMTEYLRALNQFATQVLARMGKPTVSPQQRLIRSGVVLSMASHPAPTATQSLPPPASMLPQATALTDRVGQGTPAPAPSPASGNRAAQPPALIAISDAALRARPREAPTPEEVEREVNRIIDDFTRGRLRNSFLGQLEIHQKKWPAHVMNEALMSYRRALDRLSMSTRTASLHQPDSSVPAVLAVETVPPTPDAEEVTSQSSTPAQPVTSASKDTSRPNAYSMTEAMALASVKPGALTRAVTLALKRGDGQRTMVNS